MREILFRGRSADGWVDGYYYRKTGFDPMIYPFDKDSRGQVVLPETVGQFTGLLDKNGVKIFEGDIVKYRISSSYAAKGIVKWDRLGARFYLLENKGDEWDFDSNPNEREVAGNICDNPEMIG
jgi:uncharacterized phage protein (TIGR01671 family)